MSPFQKRIFIGILGYPRANSRRVLILKNLFFDIQKIAHMHTGQGEVVLLLPADADNVIYQMTANVAKKLGLRMYGVHYKDHCYSNMIETEEVVTVDTLEGMETLIVDMCKVLFIYGDVERCLVREFALQSNRLTIYSR